jgi:hypothetical protein
MRALNQIECDSKRNQLRSTSFVCLAAMAFFAAVASLNGCGPNKAHQDRSAQRNQSAQSIQASSSAFEHDIDDLHAREDLRLENYSWIDPAESSQRRVRIPIERAMELTVERGLAVAPATQAAQPLTGDSAPTVTAPLTNGFAPTASEQTSAASYYGAR